MPKAENRKKPPNLKGQVPGRGNHNKSDNVSMNAERESAVNKKQDILNRMKGIQQKNR